MARKQAPPAQSSKKYTPDQTGILAALADAWKQEQDADMTHVAVLAAQTVRRIVEAIKAGLTRNDCAAILKTTAGALSRHILLAKAHNRPVKVGERSYPGSIEALQSGTITLSALYLLLAPVMGSKSKKGKSKESLAAAVLSITGRKMKYRNNRAVATLAILESRNDWRAALAVLLGHKIGGLSPQDVESLMDMIPATAPQATAPPIESEPAPQERAA